MTTLRKAFSLSKDEVKVATPPGTSVLVEHLERTATQATHDEIRLVPEPSDDPADPLNLPFWRKVTILAVMSIHPFVVNFAASSIGSALPIYASTGVFGFPPKPFQKLTHLIAVNLIMLGASNLFWVPLSNTFGRRPIILISLLLLTFSSMWAGLSKSFESLLAARLFMGMAGGPADAVSPDVVGEIFFVHQRGRAMAIYTLFLAQGPLVGGMAGSNIVASLGLSWIHWVNVILAAITFVLCFIFQSETLYDRPIKTLPLSNDSMEKPGTDLKERTIIEESAAAPSCPPFTYMRSLKLGTYRPGIVQKFLAPYKVMRLPGVWLISLWYAGLIGLIVTCSLIGTLLVAVPPYLWGKNVGLINIGGLVGTFLGGIYTYFVADWNTKRMAKDSNLGYSESEARLFTALPSLFISTVGSLIFGFVGQNPSPTGWVGLQFGIGMISFGLMQAGSVGFNYLIESYPSIAGDCLVAVTTMRAIISFAWSFFVSDWVHHNGPAEVFGIFAMVMGIFGLLTIPMMIWGKRLRIWTAKWVPEGNAM
ncbi:major facilitator superfamily domain-containing protein [Phaeosphaeriaceae sp. PMI808]|nr:major facilitator superfamily domain-containing protein [Phaeosphaeriaceae sp. PMI808]